jgi:uncharacterized protein (DUF608 family)
MKRIIASRRRFIGQAGLTTASLLSFKLPLWTRELIERVSRGKQPLHNIPANKNLDAAWVRSLYQRGHATTYLKSKNELKYIGMPAGGLHAGTVYLGGDGRLWLWGIYNDDREGIDPKKVLWNDGTQEVKVRNRDGASYVEPAIAANKRVLEQGFAIRLEYNGKVLIKALREEDWEEIKFEATYPTATIHYLSADCPVEVMVKAGGLFIPLDADSSAIPATVYSITLKNKTTQRINASLIGWFENGAKKITGKGSDGVKQNTAIVQEGYCSVLGDFKATNPATTTLDDGSTCITLVGTGGKVNTNAMPWAIDDATFTTHDQATATKTAAEKLVGAITTQAVLEAGKSMEANYVLSWHFNHPLPKLNKLKDTKEGYYYGKRFKNAAEAGAYIARNFQQLYGQTLLWQQTYYDSTLPHWLLERSLLNIGTLATANTYRFGTDRFWGWEGVNACEGNCTHVWMYAQAVGRIFPALEKDTRQRTDLGIALRQDGGIIFRAEYESRPAIDGQAGVILRIYREHQMSVDDSFLRSNWDNIKNATAFLLAQDKNGDGMTDTPMENTLDAVWEGEIAWIVGLGIAAAKAAQLMAEEMGDTQFANTCQEYVAKGSKNMADHLFNGSYFIHRPDAAQGRRKLGSYNTCHIDQVFGQSWAFQVGLGRLWDKEKTLQALRSMWRYNFAPDVGPYIKTHTGGRPYALAGEGGMVMNTNPTNEAQPYGEDVTWQLGYFHECMSGFEHQVASHMMAEGMTDEALVLTRAIHDRYHAARRNPFNEIECSDHYARAMASYGTFITACGFEYHGPKGYIRFAPRWNKDNFKAPFTAAAGWGSYTQQIKGGRQEHAFTVKYGWLQLQTIRVENIRGTKSRAVSVLLNKQVWPASYTQEGNDWVVKLEKPVTIQTKERLTIFFQ